MLRQAWVFAFRIWDKNILTVLEETIWKVDSRSNVHQSNRNVMKRPFGHVE